MRYLPDTHAFLWVLFDDDKLSPKAKNILSDADNEVCVSIVSCGEIRKANIISWERIRC